MKTPNKQYAKLKQISFLPEAVFNPIYPNKNTLAGKCLSRMLKGETLNHANFINDTGSWRLAAVVHILKNLGWPIVSYEASAPTADSPNRYISFYFLPPKIIEAVLSLKGEVKATPTKSGIN
jgi:hypothetical protein